MHSLFMLSQIDHEALMHTESFRDESNFLRQRLASKCPDVEWKIYDSTLGGYDVVNLLQTEDYHQLMQAWTFIQSFRGMRTKTVFGTHWDETDDVLMGLSHQHTLSGGEGSYQHW